MEAKQERSS